jgi:hypothetical protein
MAQGDVFVFDQFLVDALEGVHDLENDNIFCALTDGTTTPATTTADPRWGAAGTTDFSSEEAAPQTGSYTTGGNQCSNPSVTLNGGLAEIDFDDPATWAQNASNPTNARWGIIYNNTATGKNCIGAVDLGSTFNMTTGDLTISWGAPFATLNQA